MDSKVYAEFQKYCEKNAIMLSRRIELCMQEIMSQEEEIEKEIAKIKSKKGESNESKIESKKELEDNEDHTNKLTHRHYVG